MKKESFSSPNGPKAIGPYSAGIKFGNLIFISGQIPIDPKTNNVPEGIEKQTHLVLDNLKAQIGAANCAMDDIVQCSIFTTKMDEILKINEIYAQYFKEPYPTRMVIGVSSLPKNVLIEIAAIAGKDK